MNANGNSIAQKVSQRLKGYPYTDDQPEVDDF